MAHCKINENIFFSQLCVFFYFNVYFFLTETVKIDDYTESFALQMNG